MYMNGGICFIRFLDRCTSNFGVFEEKMSHNTDATETMSCVLLLGVFKQHVDSCYVPHGPSIRPACGNIVLPDRYPGCTYSVTI